jgi:hypothetical protein
MTLADTHLADIQEWWTKSKHFRPRLTAIPVVEGNTEYFDAGAVRIGLERRILNNEIINTYRSADSSVPAPTRVIDDGGPSVHVFGSEDGSEYLRFDCFNDGPHYHYFVPGLDGVTIFYYDRVANGDMVPWVIGALRTRMSDLLRHAGAVDLSDQVSDRKVSDALDKLVQSIGV